MGQACLNVRWTIQWSQKYRLWHCGECGGKAKGVEYSKVNAKGKRERFFRQDHDSIIHTDVEGTGNRLVHEVGCKYLAEIRKEQHDESRKIA